MALGGNFRADNFAPRKGCSDLGFDRFLWSVMDSSVEFLAWLTAQFVDTCGEVISGELFFLLIIRSCPLLITSLTHENKI